MIVKRRSHEIKLVTSGYRMKCKMCGKEAVYRCVTCGKLVCTTHIQLRPVCEECVRREVRKYFIREASDKDKELISKIVELFWGEQKQATFSKEYVIKDLPAFVALSEGKIAGFISYSELNKTDVLIVALGVLPEYQGSGIGKALLLKLEEKARSSKKKRLLVSTSNDDLPALAFYQLMGFQIFEVIPNAIANKHGAIFLGVGNIPIRDEIRLQKTITSQ